MGLGDARELGADMFFDEKYVPENVRVVQVAGFSRELCGGTHVAATGQIGSFRITGESSIGAGLRRIEAVTGEAADELLAERLEALREAATKLGVADLEVPARVEALTRPRPRVGEGRRAATQRDGGHPGRRGRAGRRSAGRRREGHRRALPRRGRGCASALGR